MCSGRRRKGSPRTGPREPLAQDSSERHTDRARALYHLACIAFQEEEDMLKGKDLYKRAKQAEVDACLPAPLEMHQKLKCEMYLAKMDARLGTDRECHMCGKVVTKLWLCADCKSVGYCSASCQKGAWRKHKLVCQEASAKRVEDHVCLQEQVATSKATKRVYPAGQGPCVSILDYM